MHTGCMGDLNKLKNEYEHTDADVYSFPSIHQLSLQISSIVELLIALLKRDKK